MPNNLVPYQGPGGVITYLQPTNTLVGGANNNGNQTINQATPYQACSAPNPNPSSVGGIVASGDTIQYQPVGADGTCPSGWTLVMFKTADEMNRALEGLLSGETQSSNVPGPPNVLTGINSPGEAAVNAINSTAGQLGRIAEFFSNMYTNITNKNLWKGIGLLVIASALILFGAFVWLRGKPNISIVR